MKATNQAWYWLAAGVLALGLNGYYQDGGLPVLHRLAYCAKTQAAKTGVQFSQMAAVVEAGMTDSFGLRCERSAPTSVVAVSPNIPPSIQARQAQLQERLGEMQAARVQARVAWLQQAMAQRELRRAQVQWQDGRISVVSDQGQVQVKLPRLPGVEVPPNPEIEFTPN